MLSQRYFRLVGERSELVQYNCVFAARYFVLFFGWRTVSFRNDKLTSFLFLSLGDLLEQVKAYANLDN